MKHLILLISLAFITFLNKQQEYICIAHIGASDKPLRPIIISKDSIDDKISYDVDGKSYLITNSRNYLVDENTYNNLKSQIIKYRKNGEYEYKDYHFFISVKGNPNHKYFLKYKESMRLLKFLIKTSKNDQKNTSITSAFEGAVKYYEKRY